MKIKDNAFVVAFILVITAVVYWPGISGPFVFDDFVNIVNNQKLKINEMSWAIIADAVTSVPNGVFGRPLSMFTFAMNNYWDRNLIVPFPVAKTFKLTNIAIHLCNSVVIYVFLRKLMSCIKTKIETKEIYSKWFPVFVCAAWALHPFNVTGVLYVVQRMSSLATLFILLGMVCYLIGREMLPYASIRGRIVMIIAVLLFTPLAFLSKEIGLLLPIYLFLIEIFITKKVKQDIKSEVFVKIYFAIVIGVPVMLVSFILLKHADWIFAGYERRNFTLEQRLITEARVVCFYFIQTAFPNIQKMGLFHDDISLSIGLFSPVETIISILALFVIMWLIIKVRIKMPMVSLGLGIFLVGHTLESTIIPLELVHEHRNYFPSLGVLMAMFALLMDGNLYKKLVRIRCLTAGALIILYATTAHSRAIEWSSPKLLWELEVARHPYSIRSQLSVGDYYTNVISFVPEIQKNNFTKAVNAYKNALAIDPNNIVAYFGILKIHAVYQQPVKSEYIDQLEKALVQEPLPANTNSYLMDILHCLGRKFCSMDAGRLEKIITIALQNPKAQPADKVLLYEVQATYRFEVTQEYLLALKAIDNALALGANTDIRLWRVNVYIRMKDFDSAREEIQKMKQQDANLHIKSKLSELESVLEYQIK